jgi:hypothetical protein
LSVPDDTVELASVAASVRTRCEEWGILASTLRCLAGSGSNGRQTLLRTALAISSFNGDEAALQLAREALSPGLRERFIAVAVIDSGDADRSTVMRESLARVSEDIAFRSYDGNLGAAGNLLARLEWAGELGADALLAVNADGRLDGGVVSVMTSAMEDADAAAVYPTAVLEDGSVDLSYRRPVPILPSRVPVARLGGRRLVRVCWGSSNGALYRVADLERADLHHLRELWHGWEDLAAGLALRELGRTQVMSVGARQPTSSDQRRLPLHGPVVSSKPPWTTYYTVRNLILIGHRHPRLWGRVILRIAREFVVIASRGQRSERYRLALAGLRDGLRRRTGLQVTPSA